MSISMVLCPCQLADLGPYQEAWSSVHVNEHNSWSMSISTILGPCQWAQSLVHVKKHGPWSVSMSTILGPCKKPWSLVHVNEHNPWSMSVSMVSIPYQQARFSGPISSVLGPCLYVHMVHGPGPLLEACISRRCPLWSSPLSPTSHYSPHSHYSCSGPYCSHSSLHSPATLHSGTQWVSSAVALHSGSLSCDLAGVRERGAVPPASPLSRRVWRNTFYVSRTRMFGGTFT